jgi:predicted permease
MKVHRSIIAAASRLVPRALRAEWRQEWDAELDARESRLDAWPHPSRRHRLRLIRDSAGAVWDALWMRTNRWQSIRFLVRHWRVTVPAGVSLAVALAATLSAAGLYEALLLRPPGVAGADRVLTMYVNSPTVDFDSVSIEDYDFYRHQSQSFSALAASSGGISLFIVPDVQERLIGMTVSGNYFGVLGIDPLLGALAFPDGAGADPHQVIISESLWRRLGADRTIVGRDFRINQVKLRVTGVAPATFTGMSAIWRTDLWFPIAASPYVEGIPEPRPDRTNRGLTLVGRLAPGVTREAAGAEIDGLSRQLATAYPQTDAGRVAFLADTTIVPPDSRTWVQQMLGAVVGLAVMTLFVAAANTVNLLLGLALSRRHEMLVRSALGASKLQLLLPLIRESLALGITAGGVGLAAAAWALDALSRHGMSLGPDIPTPTFDFRLDPVMLLAALAVVVVTSLATGIIPAWRAASDGLSGAITRELVYTGAHGGRIRGALIVVQVAVATMVLAGVGVAWKSVVNLRQADLGFTARHLMAARVPLEMARFDSTTGRQFYPRLKAAVAAVPGVMAVSLNTGMPIDSCCERTLVHTEGEAKGNDKGSSVSFAVVDDRYFSLIGMPVLSGRTFDARDVEHGPIAVVVNHTMSENRWPGQSPLGRHLTLNNGGKPITATVIGVVANGKYSDLDEKPQPFLYYALRQNYITEISVLALTTSDSPALRRAIHDVITALDPRLDIWAVRTLTDTLDLEMTFPRLMLEGITGLAVIAVLLTTIGLYGTVLHTVRQRRREIGIRIALGAQPRSLLILVLRRVVLLGVSGALVGAGLSLGLLSALTEAFYGVKPVESLLLASVVGACVSICVGVAYIAARPWTRVSAIEILRST